MKYNYCPNCGQPGGVIWQTPSTGRCNKCSKEFWNNVSATASAVFLKDKTALFAKRGIEPNKGKYDFPGGFVNFNEDIYDACVREVYEETTVKIDRTDLNLVTGYTREYIPGQSVVDLIFVVAKWKGNFNALDDVASLEWKPIEFIDSKEFAPQEYYD